MAGSAPEFGAGRDEFCGARDEEGAGEDVAPLEDWSFQQERLTKYLPLYSLPRMSKETWTSWPQAKDSSTAHLSLTNSNLRS